MARRKRSRQRSRTTAPVDPNQTVDERTDDQGRQNRPAAVETVEEAHARMAEEFDGPPPVTDEEIEAEVEREEAEEVEAPDADDEADQLEAVVPPDHPDWGKVDRAVLDEIIAHDPLPTVDWSLFERGPLAAGIQILEAMLSEAKAGYIAAQVSQLEDVLGEQFGWDDRTVLTEVAAQTRNSSGLPDIATAYRAMVARRLEAA